MTNLPAAVWNQIARTQHLVSPAAKIAFRLDADQLAKMDDLWMKEEEKAGTPESIAHCLPTCLPLLTEGTAINQYVDQHPELRNALPEINSPEEAADLMQLEWRLTPQEKTTLQQTLSSPATLERWREAAEQAKAA